MVTHVPMRCRCGLVKGRVQDVSPHTVNRCVCYCADCRAFTHYLERGDLLDASGGIEILQVARAHFSVDEGQGQLRCLRLGPKGLHRWYAACCKTPIANTLPRLPFAGLTRACLEVGDGALPEADRIHGRSAVGGLPAGGSAGLSVRAIARPARLFVLWTARGLGHPTPLFDRTGEPTVVPYVLTKAERQALRDHPRA